MHIKIQKGLDIPIRGKPEGTPMHLEGEPIKHISLNLAHFDTKFRLLAKEEDHVKIGDPIAEDKHCPARKFVSPAAGIIKEVQRGLKRAITNIVIEKDPSEAYHSFAPIDWRGSTQALIERMCEGGMFSKIRSRPFDQLAHPEKLPKAIFIKALESAPFVPPAEFQVQGFEKDFQTGIDALACLAPVHLVYREGTACKAFTQARNATLHSAEGPHPVANHSLHIQKILPIQTVDTKIWTLNAHDVVCLGYLLNENKVFIQRIVSIAGPGILPQRVGYFILREGFPLSLLIANRIQKGPMRLISGDPLNGHHVFQEDFLGFNDYAFTVVPESTQREFLHFFRLGADKYSFSRAYLSGHLNNAHRSYDFTTSLHGEHRALIDSTLMDKVQPLEISTMHLIKSVLGEDFDSAEQLGLLEVAPEDFALPAFVDPSKTEMVDIMRKGIHRYAQDVL